MRNDITLMPNKYSIYLYIVFNIVFTCKRVSENTFRYIPSRRDYNGSDYVKDKAIYKYRDPIENNVHSNRAWLYVLFLKNQ